MFSELISEPFGQIAVYLRGLQKFGQAQLGAAALFCTLLLIGTAASAQGAAALTCSPTVSPTSVPRGGGYTVTANCGGTPAANGYTYRFPDLQFSDGPTAGSTYTVAPNTALSSQPGSRRIEVSNSNGATGVVFIDVRGQLACAPTATPSTATVGDVVTLVGACTEDGVALPASAFSTGGYAETWTVSGIGTIPRRAVPVTFTVPPNTTPGTIYTASVVATNNNAPSPPTSSSTTSASITVAAPATVSIATPANGANFPVPASIPLTANATAPGTTITQVDYLFPDGSVGSATTPPFAYNWAIGVPGTYQITPRVIPAVGSAKFGTSITVTVGTPATVSIATPSSGDSFPAPATIPLTANASAPGTTITRVDYVLVDGTPIGSPNGQVIGSATAPPFAFNWPNIGPGTYRIVPRVVPAVGSPTFGLTITVVVGTPATVGITTPVSGATFTAPATIPLTATATAPGTTVTRVDYVLSDGSVIGSATTPPFALNWSNGGAGVGVGNYFIRPRVVPSVGPTQEGAQIFIRVNFAPATVVITAPADDGAQFTAPATIRLAADATAVGSSITRVDYFVGGKVIGTATAPPFTASWLKVDTGSYVITPQVVTASGQFVNGTTRTVIVRDPPTVAITSPTNGFGSVAGAPINLTANVTSSVGVAVTKVEYFANSVSVGQATAVPYAFSWVPSQPGSYSLTAVITNQAGQTATSAAIGVSIIAPPAGTVTCAVNSPAPITLKDDVTLTASCTRNSRPLNSTSLSVDETLRYNWVAGPQSPAVPPVTTGDTLKLTAGQFTRAGSFTYTVTAVVTNRRFPTSSATSNTAEATITVTVKSTATTIEVTSPPSSLKVTPGGQMNFTVMVKDGATPIANQLVSWKIVATDEKRARAKGGIQKAGCTQATDSPSSNEFTTNQSGEGVISFTASCATGGRSVSVTAAGFTRPPILLSGPDQLATGVTALNGVSQVNAEPAVATPVSVRVVDSNNVGLEGSTTTWTINPVAAGTVSATAVSIKDGIATAMLTLNAGFAKAELEACIQGSPSGTANKCQKIQIRNAITAVAEPGNAIIKPIMQQAVDAPRVQLNNIRNRLQQLRVEETVSGGSDRKDSGAIQKTTGLGLFALGEVDFAKRQSGADTTYKLRTKGVTIGADYRAQKNLVIGGAFGALVGDTTLTGGSQKTKGYSASVFGQWLPAEKWYINAIANFGKNRIDNQRTSVSGDNLTGRGTTTQQAFQVESGYALAKDGARFTPFVRYEMIRAKLKPFEESGGADALAIGGQTVRANIFGFGAVGEYAISTSSGVWIPSGRVEFLSENQKQGAAYARLVNGTPVLVPLSPEAIDKSYGTWGLNLQWLTGPSGNLISSFIGYEQTFGKTGFKNNRFTAGVKIPF